MLFHRQYVPWFVLVVVLTIFGSLILFTPTEASESAPPPQRSGLSNRVLFSPPADTDIAAALTAPGLPIIFSDDLERADNGDLGSAWVEDSGDWEIVAGRLYSPLLQQGPYTSSITIDNIGNTSVLTDYQISITIDTTTPISQGKMRSDCGDIRFYDEDQATPLNYWLESGCNTDTTIIWTKVPTIPAAGIKKIYLGYGNSSLTSASDGEAVFEFFDDFADSDISDWVSSSATTDAITVADGQVRIREYQNYHANIRKQFSGSLQNRIVEGIIEYDSNEIYIGESWWPRITLYKSSATHVGVGPVQQSTGTLPTNRLRYLENGNLVSIAATNYGPGSRVAIRIAFEADQYTFGSRLEGTSNWDGETTRSYTVADLSDAYVVLGKEPDNVDYASSGGIGTHYWDLVYVRKYISTEPTVTLDNDLSLTISGPMEVPVGQTITYTLTLTNSGPGEATGVVLTDTLPAEVVFGSAIPSQGSCSGSETVICDLGTLNNSAVATVTLTVTPTQTGLITNTAYTAGNEPDPNLNNNTATLTATIVSQTEAVDLSLTQAVAPYSIIVGDPLTYTLTLTNNGLDDATGVVLTDTLPAEVVFSSAIPSQGSCSGSETVICNLGSLVNSAVATVTLIVTPTQTGLITNSAVVESNEFDSIPADNMTTLTSTVGHGLVDAVQSQIEVVGNSIAAADGSDTVQIQVIARDRFGNPIPDALSIMTSTHSISVTPATWSTDINGVATGYVASEQVGIAEIGAVISDTFISQAISDTVSVTFESSISDLTLAKSAPSTAMAGTPITYTLTVTNSGNMTATYLVIGDEIPNGAGYISGGTRAGDSVTWTVASLAPNSSVSVQFVVSATETITNEVYAVSADGGIVAVGSEPVVTVVSPPVVADFSAFPRSETAPALVQFFDYSTGNIDNYLWDFGDGITATLSSPTHSYTSAGVYTVSLAVSNLGGDSDTLTRTNYITVTPPLAADLRVSKTAPVSAVVGAPITYTLTLTNSGPSEATGVVLTDTLPAEVVFGSAIPSQGSCSGSETVTCNLGSLANGAVATVTLVTTPTQTGLITNTTYIAGNELDPDLNNNTAILTSTVVAPILICESVDLPDYFYLATSQVTNWPDMPLLVEPYWRGSPRNVWRHQMWLKTTNPLTNVVEARFTISKDDQGACSYCVSSFYFGESQSTYSRIYSFPSGAEDGIVITRTINSPTHINFYVEMQAESETADISLDDVELCRIVYQTDVVDLSLAQTTVSNLIMVGEPLTYTLTLTNSGPGEATGVVLTDTLPAEVVLSSAIPSQGSCSGSETVICNLGTLNNSAVATVTLTVTPTQTGLITNTAYIAGDEPDPDLNNNTAILTSTVVTPTVVTTVPLGINNLANASVLTDYQVSITFDTATPIARGDMRSDCGDIRFYDEDQATPLNYWLESGCNTNTTVIWTKVPTIPAAGTKKIYLVYGNFGLTTASDGDTVFEFFDDFEGASLDINKWSIDTGITYSVEDSKLIVSNSPATGLPAKFGFKAIGYSPLQNGFVVEAKDVYYYQPGGGYIFDFGLLLTDGTLADGPIREAFSDAWTSYTGQRYGKIESTTYTSGKGSLPNDSYHQFKIEKTLDDQTTIFWNEEPILGPYVSTTNIDSLYVLVNRYSSSYSYGENSIDWIRVRKHISTEPTVIVDNDLSLTISGPVEVPIETPITYTLVLTNNGLSEAAGVVLTDTLSPNMVVGATTPSQGSCNGSETVTCNLGSLANGAVATVTLVATPTRAGMITNSAVVESNQIDPLPVDNTATYTSTALAPGPALEFDGSDDYIELYQNIDFSGDTTAEAWIYLEDLSAENVILARTNSCTGSVREWVPYSFSVEADGSLSYNVRSTSTCSSGFNIDSYVSDPGQISAGRWYHVALRVQNNSAAGRVVEFYIDGQKVPSSQLNNGNPSAAQNSSQRTRIGACYRGSLTCRNFNGIIDEVRLWSGLRAESDIQNMMYTPLIGNEPGLAGYWRLDEGSGQMVVDSTTTGNDGQLGSTADSDTNDPTWIPDQLLPIVAAPVTITFTADPITGLAPLAVTFTTTTTGASSLRWNFGDGLTQTITSTVLLPPAPLTATHTYTQAGVYTVTLTAAGPGGSKTLTRSNYITATTLLDYNWQLITTTNPPPIIGEHVMSYDSDRDVVVVYGGNATGWPYEDTTWELNGTDWISTTTLYTPAARYGMAVADTGIGILLFGGTTADNRVLNQTWVYTNSQWLEVFPTTAPLSRTHASMVAGSNGTVYLFGGNEGTTQYNDLWAYQNGEWTDLSPAAGRPPARTHTALAYDPNTNQLWLFGGRSITGTELADLWAFDLTNNQWTLIPDGGGGPPARLGHTLTYDPATQSVVLIGGSAENGNTRLGDTWHYRNGEWTEVIPTTALPPRAYQQVVAIGNGLILFSQGEVWRYE